MIPRQVLDFKLIILVLTGVYALLPMLLLVPPNLARGFESLRA